MWGSIVIYNYITWSITFTASSELCSFAITVFMWLQSCPVHNRKTSTSLFSIIESVGSIYRDSAGMLYMNNTPCCECCKSTKLESRHTAKLFNFLSSSFSSSDWLVQNYVTLSPWFLHKTATIYAMQCTSPSPFHNFVVSQVLKIGH